MTQGDGTPDQPARIAPIGADRLGSLDFIRGIAVMGILWANIAAFAQPMTAAIYPGAFAVAHGTLSDALWFVQFVLIDGKMRGLFTLLFGAGLMLFMERAWARGASRWLQARRLVWLLAFGAIHFFLIWKGDILMLYALSGAVVTLCLRWTAKTQLTVGVLGYVAGSLMMAAIMGPLPFVAETELGERPAFAEMRDSLAEQKADDMAEGTGETALIRSGSYANFVGHNWSEHGMEAVYGALTGFTESIPLMLIGAALYRRGLFDGAIANGALMRWGWIGVGVGTVLTVPIGVWAWANGLTYWGTLGAQAGFAPLPRLPVTVGLLALLVAHAPKATGWLGSRVSAAGRAAFTNYLGTSIVLVVLFHGWGGALFGVMNRPQLLLVMLGVWIVMLAWSKPWLDRYRYGPLEWLWRCLTYARMFPLKR